MIPRYVLLLAVECMEWNWGTVEWNIILHNWSGNCLNWNALRAVTCSGTHGMEHTRVSLFFFIYFLRLLRALLRFMHCCKSIQNETKTKTTLINSITKRGGGEERGRFPRIPFLRKLLTTTSKRSENVHALACFVLSFIVTVMFCFFYVFCFTQRALLVSGWNCSAVSKNGREKSRQSKARAFAAAAYGRHH